MTPTLQEVLPKINSSGWFITPSLTKVIISSNQQRQYLLLSSPHKFLLSSLMISKS